MDNEAPVISSFTADNTNIKLHINQSQNVTFVASLSDNVEITLASLPTATLISINDGTYTWLKTYNHSSGSTIDTLTLTVEDAAGNSSTSNVTVTVTAFTFTTVPAAYTISATVNMNESVTESQGVLGFRTSTISSSSGAVTNYYLPSGSAQIPCGSLSASGTNLSITGILNGTIDVSVSSSGLMSSSVVISGSGYVATTSEKLNTVQHVYWSGIQSPPSLTATSPDILTASYSEVDLRTQYASVISTIESLYSGNMIQTWTFQVPEIQPHQDSLINQFAIYYDRSYPQVFQNGDEIALQTTYPYSVTITDVNGEIVTVIPQTPIYAMLKHSDNAQPMD
jgi:hypothetical protein